MFIYMWCMNFWTAEANLRRIWRIQFESQIKCPSAEGRKKRVPTFFLVLWSSLTSAHTKREVETGFSKGLYGLLHYVAIYPYKNSTSRSRAKHQNTWNDFPRFSSDRKMAVQYSTVLYSSAGSLVRSSSSIIQYRPYLRIIQRMYHMISHDNRTMYYCTV